MSTVFLENLDNVHVWTVGSVDKIVIIDDKSNNVLAFLNI